MRFVECRLMIPPDWISKQTCKQNKRRDPRVSPSTLRVPTIVIIHSFGASILARIVHEQSSGRLLARVRENPRWIRPPLRKKTIFRRAGDIFLPIIVMDRFDAM